MDKSEFFSRDFLQPYDRPIVLSPPPMENQNKEIDGHHGQRQQSVGYNLQQEFEALKNDLDLDLSQTDDRQRAGTEQQSSELSLLDSPPVKPQVKNGQTGINNISLNHQPFSPSHILRGMAGQNFFSPQYGHGLASTLLENLGPQLLLQLLLPQLLVPSRPQSVNDFSNLLPRNMNNLNINELPGLVPQSNFYLEMYAFTLWMENLAPQDILAMLSHWCAVLPFDILLTMKSKLEAHLNLLNLNLLNLGSSGLAQKPFSYMDYEEQDGQLPVLAQPKPKANSFKSHVFANVKPQRPKLADPSLLNRPQGQQGQNPPGLDRVRLPTLHLYEKTNFLQLAAASHLPLSAQHQSPGATHAQTASGSSNTQQEDNFDLLAALKMGALATINSRVALDSNRKSLLHQQMPSQPRFPHSALQYEELINRGANSLSAPAPYQKYNMAASGPLAAGLKLRKELDSPKNRSQPLTPSPSAGASSMPPEIASVELLNNIPAWLKLLRLHKYTDCLKGLHWKTLVDLSDEQLEERGVKALGARRKLLKAFDAVKQASIA